ncbi:MAG TPA: DUF4332 domain-containing protein, partial [Candidatus Thermoplasmatota archaeon]|nr:DUF4332 domain-containing protein [Candidatus Thermoplasmatota archaeon]
INGIGKQYSELLVRAGVTSVQEVATSRPAELTQRLQKYQEGLDTNVQGNPITEGLVEDWIREAKQAR